MKSCETCIFNPDYTGWKTAKCRRCNDFSNWMHFAPPPGEPNVVKG